MNNKEMSGTREAEVRREPFVRDPQDVDVVARLLPLVVIVAGSDRYTLGWASRAGLAFARAALHRVLGQVQLG